MNDTRGIGSGINGNATGPMQAQSSRNGYTGHNRTSGENPNNGQYAQDEGDEFENMQRKDIQQFIDESSFDASLEGIS